MKKLLAALLFVLLVPAFALAQTAPEGLWSRTNDQGETHIKIEPAGTKFTGTIDWMENPRNDTQNPNPDLRNRPLVGVQIFEDMTQVSGTKWEGSLYNPEDGNTYSGSLEVINQDELKLQGCVFIIFCQSDTWTRVP